MNKELTPLEALEEYKSIKDYYYHRAKENCYKVITLRVFDEEDKIYETIENELKRLEKQNEILERTLNKVVGEKNGLAEILRIIKEHKLMNYVIKNKKCASMYHLTQDEIDLLKEELA